MEVIFKSRILNYIFVYEIHIEIFLFYLLLLNQMLYQGEVYET